MKIYNNIPQDENDSRWPDISDLQGDHDDFWNSIEKKHNPTKGVFDGIANAIIDPKKKELDRMIEKSKEILTFLKGSENGNK